jgi:multiple sugar transport system permease protein
MRLSTAGRMFGLMMYLPSFVLLCIFIVYPLGLLLFNSLHEYSLLHSEIRTFIGFGNFVHLFRSERFLLALRNTVLYVITAVPLEFAIGLVAALLLNTRFRGSQPVRTIMLFPLMLAPVVVGLIWRFIFADQYGILNWTLFRLKLIANPSEILWLSNKRIALFSCVIADVWLTTPFMMLVLLAGLQNIPNQLIEAAKIDGASAMQVFFRVIVPLLSPVISVAVSIRLIDAFRTFDIIWMLTQGGPEFGSEVISTHIYRVLMRFFEVGLSSAMSVIFLVVLLAVSIFFLRRLWRQEDWSSF